MISGHTEKKIHLHLVDVMEQFEKYLLFLRTFQPSQNPKLLGSTIEEGALQQFKAET